MFRLEETGLLRDFGVAVTMREKLKGDREKTLPQRNWRLFKGLETLKITVKTSH